VKGAPLTAAWGEGGALAHHVDKGLARAGQGLGSTVAVQIALQGHLEVLLAGAGQCGGHLSVTGLCLAADVWECHHGCRSRPCLGETTVHTAGARRNIAETMYMHVYYAQVAP
jgi:hypothetical protein